MKKKLGLIFGGKSEEHSISVKSAHAVLNNLDRTRFEPVLIYINREGSWAEVKEDFFTKQNSEKQEYKSLLPWEIITGSQCIEADIFFPVLHGPNGEDGRIQGLLEMTEKPFISASSLGSQLAMHKGIAKKLFISAGLKTPQFLTFTTDNMDLIHKEINEKLSMPLFVKPCSLGSSVGINKVNCIEELQPAVQEAFKNDSEIIIEQAYSVREIEVSVMGNSEPAASLPGELIPENEFYDYNDKYVDNKTSFDIPAKLSEELVRKIRNSAVKAFKALNLNSMARVDFFIDRETGDLMINEINTIPGFTEISMFPKLWALEGISFKELINRLAELAFEYYNKNKRH